MRYYFRLEVQRERLPTPLFFRLYETVFSYCDSTEWVVTCHKKRPPSHIEMFYYRSLGATTVVPTENVPTFFRLFFKVLKAFQ